MSAPAGIVSFKDETAAQQHYDRENDEFDVPVASWDWKKAVDCLLCVGPDGAGTRQEGFAHVIFLIVFTLVALAQTASWPNVSAFNEAIHDRFQLQVKCSFAVGVIYDTHIAFGVARQTSDPPLNCGIGSKLPSWTPFFLQLQLLPGILSTGRWSSSAKCSCDSCLSMKEPAPRRQHCKGSIPGDRRPNSLRNIRN